MLENYLPKSLVNTIDKIPYNSLCELRLRADNAVMVNILGENYYLCENCVSQNMEQAYKISKGEIQSIISKISNNSLYTINEQLISGFVTLPGGIRVGVCGEVVDIDNKVKTVKNISSLNFRFPHFIKNCSLKIYPYIVSFNNVKSTLIVSPPGAGKTTMLRDLVYQLSEKEKLLNILVVDERKEIASIFNGKDYIKLNNIDVITLCSKQFGFTNGIRSVSPNVIVTDEINLDKDCEIIENALTCGVKVIATIHASSIQDLKNKPQFREILNKKLFERYVVLSATNGLGTIDGIYDENLALIGV